MGNGHQKSSWPRFGNAVGTFPGEGLAQTVIRKVMFLEFKSCM